ncbi:uncharacterized protein BP01DRAFT_380957 [Aspergillus saccharolyticus JOP 1030-1]|uniref:Uncharacterized protein n=1 Tax=Aspergillus saccharolyticus JOP 1030-1 TaxID=1450539 RepID=A0A319AKH1_9EURO|nr:hypothetical protein BP01DRAFT_380957 [Aspergillus saccharolyticus JOP 1030-1]PYH47112.1 hypothetical protein BP01DRAFT_380957 [Aspergillus saccharolyticus JOP 1030-1]
MAGSLVRHLQPRGLVQIVKAPRLACLPPLPRHAYLLPEMLKVLHQHDAQTLFQPDFFENRRSAALNATFRVVQPVAQYEGAAVELGYAVGTRGNGVDLPSWPVDLRTETVR